MCSPTSTATPCAPPPPDAVIPPSTPRSAGGDLVEPTLEVAAFGADRAELECARVRSCGLIAPVEPAEQIRARRVEVLVPVKASGERVDEFQAGVGAIRHRHRHRA